MRLIGSDGRRPAAAVLLSALALGGCSADSGDALPRVAVSGTVTLDGTPLPEGTIQFDPAKETPGPPVSGEISGGKFSIGKPSGPVADQYEIRISSIAPVKFKEGEQPGPVPRPRPETVPEKYNTKTTLSKGVTADGPNQFDFALVTK